MTYIIALGFILLTVGAIIGYFGKGIYKIIYNKDPDQITVIKVKALGLLIFLIGVIIIFKYIK